LINTDDARVPALRAALDEIGDSVVVSGGDGLWNVHLHTNDAPAAVELGAAAGRPYDVRVTEIGQGRTPDSLADSADHLSADHFSADHFSADHFSADHLSADHLSAGRVIAVVLAPNSAALPICDLLTRSGAYIVEASELVQLGASELVVLVEDAGLVDGATASDDGTRTELVRRAAEATGVPAAAIGIAAPVQFLSAVAVHDPHRSIAEDAAAMGAAAVSTRYAVVGPGLDDALVTDSVAEISQLLVGGGDLVTVVCAEEVGARIAEDLAAVRPDLDVNHLSVETLPSLVWLGVE
jgi:dihydroxyacetone kinase-like predicted kinase